MHVKSLLKTFVWILDIGASTAGQCMQWLFERILAVHGAKAQQSACSVTAVDVIHQSSIHPDNLMSDR